MPPSPRIGRLLGISVRLHWTWPIVLGLIFIMLAIWLLPTTYPGWSTPAYWLVAVLAGTLFLVSVLAHELNHSLVARYRGETITSFTLFTFGGISNVQESAASPINEFILATVGPLTNIALGLLASLLAVLTASFSEPLAALLICLGILNLLLGLLNLVPGLPLDGGRLLRAMLWFLSGNRERPTNIASGAGRLLAGLMIVGGVVLVLTGSQVIGLVALLTGLLVVGITGRGYRRAVQEEQTT